MTSPSRNPLAGVLPWVIAGVVLLVLAAVGGVGAAYIVTTAQAVPTVDPAKLPTPAPSVTPAPASSTPTAEASPSATEPASAAPSAEASSGASSSPGASPSPSAAGPSPTPLAYVVRKGDRLSDIAAQFGVSVDAIATLNHITNPDHIVVGQVLLIPVP